MQNPPFKKNLLSIPVTARNGEHHTIPNGADTLSRGRSLNWVIPPAEMDLVHRIGLRGAEMAQQVGVQINRLQCVMAIVAVHLNDRPLKLYQFLISGNDDFSHDFTGIARHVDASTGKLRDGFTPRCAESVS